MPQKTADLVVDPKIVDGLGVKEHTKIEDAPVVVSEGAGASGTGKIVEIRQTVKRMNLPQPFITLEEAKELGKQSWKVYATKAVDKDGKLHKAKSLYTAIVHGRRFLITKDIHAKLK